MKNSAHHLNIQFIALFITVILGIVYIIYTCSAGVLNNHPLTEFFEALITVSSVVSLLIFLFKCKNKNRTLQLAEKEHILTQNALSHSHDLMKYIIEHNRSAVAVHDCDLKYIYVNQRYLDDFKISECNVIGKHFYEVLPDLSQKWVDIHKRVLAGEILSSDNDSFEHGDATIEWIRWECRPWYMSDNSIGGIIFYSEIITLRKKAEDEMREREQRYLSLYQKNKATMLLIDSENFNIVDANPAACQFYGWTREEIVTKKITDINTLSTDEVKEEMKKAFSENQKYFLFKHRLSNGEIRDVEVYSGPIIINGHRLLFSLIHDITERKMVENKLIESEEKYRSILQASPDLIVITDLEGKLLTVSHVSDHMFGINSNDGTGHYFFEFIIPEDRERAKSTIIQKLQGQPSSPGHYHGVRSDGSIFDIEVNGDFIRDAEGRPTKIVFVVRDITERNKIEKALHETEERNKALLKANPDMMFILDETGRFIDFNPGKNCPFNTIPENFTGKMVTEVMPPESAELCSRYIKQLFETGQMQVFTYSIELDSELQFFEGRLVLSGNKKALLIVSDITTRLKKEEKIKQQAEAMDAASEGLAIYDQNLTFIYANKSFGFIYGYDSSSELIGRPKKILYKKDEYERFENEILPVLSRFGNFHGRVIGLKKDGTKFSSSINLTLLENGGIICAVRDITEHIKAEMELIRAKEKAEESDRLKSAFLANMSHEIRTPMNGILGFAGLLKEHDLPEKERDEYVGIIEQSGERLLNIINDIIEISKIEAGMVEIKIAQSNINDQLEYIRNLFRPEVEKKGMKLMVKNGVPSGLAVLKIDAEKLYAVLINLVKNAIKYSNEGTIEVGYEKKKNHFEFYVKDTGIGIPEEKHEAVFNRFVQADMGNKRAFEGAGLGLAITRAYVEMMGGKIWLKSKEGVGSEFYFTLPSDNKIDLLKDELDKKNLISEEIKIRKLKILIVEDDKLSEKLLIKLLRNYSRNILLAVNGLEAVRLCRENSDIDLILMDIQMADMDGYEATQRIREFNKNVVIIAQTAFAMSHNRKEALECGCNDYISKPIKKEILAEVILNHFEQVKNENYS